MLWEWCVFLPRVIKSLTIDSVWHDHSSSVQETGHRRRLGVCMLYRPPTSEWQQRVWDLLILAPAIKTANRQLRMWGFIVCPCCVGQSIEILMFWRVRRNTLQSEKTFLMLHRAISLLYLRVWNITLRAWFILLSLGCFLHVPNILCSHPPCFCSNWTQTSCFSHRSPPLWDSALARQVAPVCLCALRSLLLSWIIPVTALSKSANQ